MFINLKARIKLNFFVSIILKNFSPKYNLNSSPLFRIVVTYILATKKQLNEKYGTYKNRLPLKV